LTRHIGIVAVSQEGAALCYRQILRQAGRLLPPGRQPRVSLHNEPLSEYIKALNAQDWHTVGDLLRRSAEILAGCGAEFCFTPDHAVEHGLHLAETGSAIPWLTMPELVAEAVARDSRRVVGLIGTKWVTTGATYQTKLGLRGIQVLAPEAAEAEALNGIIFNELIFGEIRPQSQRQVLGIIENLARRGCEGVIFGCSEAPLLVTPETSSLPVYDASDLLAQGAVRRVMEPAVP
jgi:aspartate racemase